MEVCKHEVDGMMSVVTHQGKCPVCHLLEKHTAPAVEREECGVKVLLEPRMSWSYAVRLEGQRIGSVIVREVLERIEWSIDTTEAFGFVRYQEGIDDKDAAIGQAIAHLIVAWRAHHGER